jgi:hypothetical protein
MLVGGGMYDRQVDNHQKGSNILVGTTTQRISRVIISCLVIISISILATETKCAKKEQPFKLSVLSVADKLLYIKDEDLNVDGLRDILIIHRKGLPPEETRWLSVFWQRSDGGFSTAADQSWEIDSTAIVLDVGDVWGDEKLEICFLTESGVRYYPVEKGAYGDSTRILFETDGLIAMFPSKRTIPQINFVRDWNEDGRDEVAVYKIDGISIFHRDSTGVYSTENKLRMKLRTRVGRIRSEGVKEQTAGLWTSYSFPVMRLIDFNGDGMDDLFTMRNDWIRVYIKRPDRFFETEPALDKIFDVLTQKEKIEGIANIETIVYDINNDGYADMIVTKQTAKGLSNFRGVINVFHGGPEEYSNEPQQVIISEGTASAQSFIRDVNGDGGLDLILPSVKISISAIIRFLITRSVPINFNIFLLGEDNMFSDRPDFSKEVKFKIDFSGDSDTQAMDIDGDYNNDRRKDFVFATSEDELSIYLGISGEKDRLFSKKPVAKVEAEAFGDLLSPDLNNDGYSDMIIYYPQSKDKKGMVQVLMNLKLIQ